MVAKLVCVDNVQIYSVSNDLYIQRLHIRELNPRIYYVEKVTSKASLGWEGYMRQDRLSLSNDIEICSKAIFFLESWHFYLKVKDLLRLFSYNNDIIHYICFIYFQRTIGNLSNIRCKLL